MKVTDNRSKEAHSKAKDIKFGEAFEYCGNFFMRIAAHHIFAEYCTWCVNLRSGVLEDFTFSTHVRPVTSEVIITAD